MNSQFCDADEQLVSILSPVYNEGNYLSEMIDSVLAQDHESWELLIVDDGSTDDTAEVARRYAAADRRVRLISSGRKLGKVEAFNTAFSASQGSFIVLLAGDDTLPSTSLMHRLTTLRTAGEPLDAVGCFRLRTFSSNRRYHDLVLPRGGGTNMSGGTIMVGSRLAASVFPIDATLVSEDPWLGIALRSRASQVVSSQDVVLHYRIHSGNSNPRNQPFDVARRAFSQRARAYASLLADHRLHFDDQTRRDLVGKSEAAEMIEAGQPLRILFIRNLKVIDRVALACAASPFLHFARKVLFRSISGRRQ